MTQISRRTALVASAAAVSGLTLNIPAASARELPDRPAAVDRADAIAPEVIDRYQPRFGRKRPVVVVIGLNEGSEITDFMVPFGALARSGVAEVLSVSTVAGPVVMRPLRMELQG